MAKPYVDLSINMATDCILDAACAVINVIGGTTVGTIVSETEGQVDLPEASNRKVQTDVFFN